MDSLLHLLFPSICLLCALPGASLCNVCDSKIHRVMGWREIDGVPLWAGAYYGDELAQLILLTKEENNVQARNYLARLIVETFMSAKANFNQSAVLALVPIPSSALANRKRGYRHSYLLARRAAALIERTTAYRVEVREALRVNRKVADQSNLNRAQRVRNISGAYSVESRHNARISGSTPEPTFLIDDLVTSGTSIREGLRALGEQGITPSGVLAAGVSPRVFS